MENSNKTMNILLSCDDRIAKYIPALQASLYENHKGIDVHIFIMHTKIPSNVIETIKEFAVKHGQTVEAIIVNNNDFEMFKRVDPSQASRFPIEAYYYFLAHQYLPSDLERCMYLDVDTICESDVYGWYNSDFNGAFFITSDLYKKDYYYACNSGVFVINLKKMREQNINGDFYLEKLNELSNENDKKMHGDQEFLGYAFRKYPNNGFNFIYDRGINFRMSWNLQVAVESEPLPQIKIIHYIGIKAWRYLLDESFQNRLIKGIKWGHYDFSFLSGNVISSLNLFWKYAKLAPFYEEIRLLAIGSANELRSNLDFYNTNRKLMTMLAVTDRDARESELLRSSQIYGICSDYNMIRSQGDGYIEYKTNYYIREQWIFFRLKRTTRKGEKIVVKIKCEYKTDNKIFLFLSDYNLQTQHFPSISSEDYNGEITVNADGYQFLCLSSNSFQRKGDYIRFYDFSADIKTE